MTQTSQNNRVVPVVLDDADGRLKAGIFASREGIVTVTPFTDGEFSTGRAVKATIALEAFTPGDFVIRSVKSGKRRTFEVLAGSTANGLLQGERIALTDGDDIAVFPGAICVAS